MHALSDTDHGEVEGHIPCNARGPSCHPRRIAPGAGINTRSFAPDGTGAEVAFRSLSQSTAKMRSQVRERVVVDKEDFFRGEKDAEVDRTTRWV